jgi:glycine amidinotransferase
MKDNIVNSHNEWDTLEEVILGAGFSSSLPSVDLTFRLFFHDNIYEQDFNGRIHLSEVIIKKKHIEEMKEDMEKLKMILEDFGVKVRRPKILKKVTPFNTPYWKSTTYHALNVRDLTIIIGNEIIESSIETRYRYFETDLMKHLFKYYFDRGAKWTMSPRPLILDHSFDLSYTMKQDPTGGAIEYYKSLMQKKPHEMNYGYEIMFDAAQCMRLGRDIIFNCSTENHRLGATWLQRHLGDEYKVWPVELCDSHMDSTFVPLKPGLALVDWKSPLKEKALPEWLQKWDLIEAPPSYYKDDYDEDDLLLASQAIDINVISLDQNTIICHDRYYKQLQPLLKPYNIECIPCSLRHSRIFSGAFHCLTLDIRRKSKLEGYR